VGRKKVTYAKYIELLKAGNGELEKISRDNLLALDLNEMKCIQSYYRKKKTNPTDIELETIAQTWSEHCKHKTLAGNISYRGPGGKTKTYNNLLKSTIFRATRELKKRWCISVFEDNAGIIEFNRDYGIAFKVETHNHPSALEPYGGAGTGIGGVIRDILGVGLGARPILNTDVFCFGPLKYNYKELPEGVLHPKRIMKGVVSGVRDYGNRMGIPTVNGAVLFDEKYVCNPLVYCGTVGIIPKKKSFKKVSPGNKIVAVGGRTGRDGIHGATFSSLGMNKDTPLSPVQIGNPVMEKKVTDTVLRARDEGLYSAITDCGAGGFSSAIGELGSACGAKVYLERAPLKYEGIPPWEIWVSEAQERMVLAVPRAKLRRILEIFASEDVEATVLGEFTSTGRLEVLYKKEIICDLGMKFLHGGLPKRVRKAVWKAPKNKEPRVKTGRHRTQGEFNGLLRRILARPNVCSKEWVVRQYDHEVQSQTVLKPLQGRKPFAEGPGDASVAYPAAEADPKAQYRGIAVGCGINPEYGKIDPYWMAAGVIDEALRNVVCVGGDIERTALLDNFCWGSCSNPENLAGVVRACEACYDMSKAYGVPFISGKDSLNNEFRDEKGRSQSIPPTLLVSAVSIVGDVQKCVSMDLKNTGGLIYVLGTTFEELGGSQYLALQGYTGNDVPKVNPAKSRAVMAALKKAMDRGLVSACHDCSDGGFGAAIAEMAFAGGLGAGVSLKDMPYSGRKQGRNDDVLLFSESHGRFIAEVKPSDRVKFEGIMKGIARACVGKVAGDEKLVVTGTGGRVIINDTVNSFKRAWQSTLSGM